MEHVTQEKKAELEEFIDYAKTVIGALGYRIFEPIIETAEETSRTPPLPIEPPLTLTLNQVKKETIITHGKALLSSKGAT